MYRLHTLDIYFWTREDAQKFLNGVRRVLPEIQLTLADEPIELPTPADDMSTVVQNLENVAITDPSYRHAHSRGSGNTSISTQASALQSNRDVAQSTHSSVSIGSAQAAQQNQESASFAPLAYNPAAPAAPEAIQHREMTPPPEDGAVNPLLAAANADQVQTYGVPNQFPGGGFSGPPQQTQPSYFTGRPGQTMTSPPQQQQVQSPYAQHFQHSFAPPPTSASNLPPGPPAYQAHAPAQNIQLPSYPGSPGFTSPGMGVRSPSFPPVSTAAEAHPSLAPPGGFAQYNYKSLSGTAPLMTDYSIHQQVYRPTEYESVSHHKPPKPPSGRMEARAGQIEKGVSSLLKRIEKKIA